MNLITHRFDIKIKLLYLQDKEKWSYMYFYHLLLWGGGRIYEWDGSKSSYDDFLTAFDNTYQSLKESGWKGAPIRCIKLPNGDIYPIEGAHRIACCLHLGIEPEIVMIKGQCELWNAYFFKRMGMLESEIKKVEYAK
jgi:hypothetical protein